MDKIALIKTEIERRMKAYDESIEKYADKKKSMKAERGAWKWAECKSLLSFLSTLEKSEKPINHEEELEAEIQSFWNRASGFQPKFATLEVKENGFATIARHFAKWGAEHSGSSEIPNDLEEAADNHIRKVADIAGHPGWDWTTQDIADAFIAGAKWDRQQMLKEAVEGTYAVTTVGHFAFFPNKPIKDLCFGDKVRIIIVKE